MSAGTRFIFRWNERGNRGPILWDPMRDLNEWVISSGLFQKLSAQLRIRMSRLHLQRASRTVTSHNVVAGIAAGMPERSI
jgi:hypothetical protein